MKKLSLMALLGILLFGCGNPLQGPPSIGEIQANIRSARPTQYKEKIHAYYKEVLFDPFSAKVEIGEPGPGWYGSTGALLVKRNINYAWLVRARVNAKNRLGAYVGWNYYMFFFDGERLVHVIKQ